ncbi:hypothetical protein [Imhoffiella purpurea]|uniref:hypothetical protein n=1 Tax=Imhoffiella purpurea TaxID=1249627 RepID=UPI0005C1DA17|nr:hypothetical protein [Imhoffiella purpurea]
MQEAELPGQGGPGAADGEPWRQVDGDAQRVAQSGEIGAVREAIDDEGAVGSIFSKMDAR